MPPDLSYSQTDFSAGEWSPNFRGRIDEKEYPSALALCLNYIPNQEGSLSARTGFLRCGITRFGAVAKLLPFRFNYYEPYVAEHTENNLRFWSNGRPIVSIITATLVSVAGDPPTFTIDSDLAGDTNVPTTWINGSSVLIAYWGADIITHPHLVNREFRISIVSRSAGTITLSDAETGSPLTGTVAAKVNSAKLYRILDVGTPFEDPLAIRQVAFTSQTQKSSQNDAVFVVTGPEHRVSYLHSAIVPRSVSHSKGLEYSYVSALNGNTYGLVKEDFIDGPYLDPITDVTLKPSGTSGSITLTIHGYDATIIYGLYDVTWDSTTSAAFGNFFVSLVANNIGNALPTPPAATDKWASLPILWSSLTTYFLGQPATDLPQVDGAYTVYFSVQAANLNHATSDAAWWSTTPPTYSALVTYSDGAVVVSAGIQYVSIVAGNIANTPVSSPTFWLPVVMQTAINAIQNNITGWAAGPVFNSTTDAGDSPTDGAGRLIRLKSGPAPWKNTYTYTAGDEVNFKDNLYVALTSANLGLIPDQNPLNWELMSRTILWTWCQITGVTSAFKVTVTIRGDALPDTDIIYEWRLGLFSDTTGWPHCGTFHEGRICFAGPISNRIDMGRSNLGYDFTPTAPDGTVADNNAISYVFNSREDERIHALASTAEGIVALTSEREWLVSASNLSDPLTPTSIQAHPTTGFATTDAEACILPSGIAFIQSGRRRLMEHRSFVDVTNYQSRLNAVDLTRKCQHLTGDGIIEAQYQRIPQPVIWCLPGGVVKKTTQPDICPPAGTFIRQSTIDPYLPLFGIGYCRTPELSYIAPFSYEHGIDLAASEVTKITSIAVQRGNLDTAEYLYTSLNRSESGNCYVEMLTPIFEGYPPDDVFYTSGAKTGTVKKFGMISGACFLDSAVQPLACQIAVDGLSATFYGLWPHKSTTVSFTIRGRYVGDFAISSTGTVNVPFVTGTFEKADLGRAEYQIPNSTLLPVCLGVAEFYLDVNGNTGVFETFNVDSFTKGFRGFFGLKYRRRGQQLRPSAPGANGPAFAKVRRNERMGVYLDTGQEVSIGDTFNTLNTLPLVVDRTDGKVGTEAPTRAQFVTGIFRDAVTGGYTFDGGLCWQQTRPVPGSILAVGGFELLTDT